MKCKCNECNKDFKMKVAQLRYIPRKYAKDLPRDSEGKIIIEGFECPYCHKEYITTVTDNKLREGMFLAKELNDEMIELSRKQDKEYAAYMEDIGKVPTQLCIKYAKQLEELQCKYRHICRMNKLLEKEVYMNVAKAKEIEQEILNITNKIEEKTNEWESLANKVE